MENETAKPVRVLIVIGSTRPGRIGLPVGQWIANAANLHGGIDVDFADLAEINLPFFDEPKHPRFKSYEHEHTKVWSARVDAAQAVVFVTPEYNHAFPAPLKNALDFLSQEWGYKPAGLVSYGGGAGGTRAVQLLKPVLNALRMIPLNESVIIQNPAGYVNAHGVFEPSEALAKSADGMFTAIQEWVTRLQP